MDKKYEGFTLGLALVDALPVLFFGAAFVLVGIAYGDVLFLIGAGLAFAAGFIKVLWKILVAVAHKDIRWMNKQFRYLMMVGFVLIIVSVVIGSVTGAIAWSTVGRLIIGLPQVIFFALWVLGLAGMIVCASKLDPSVARNNWIEQGINGFAQLMGLIGVLICIL